MYHSESIDISAAPDVVFDTVRQLDRMGEWSPESTGGAWTKGDGTSVGDEFDGVNRIGDRQWNATATVVRSEPGVAFAFHTGPPGTPMAEWTYLLEANGDGTTLTEIWEVHVLPPTLVNASAEQLAGRAEMVKSGMQATLAGMKASIEA